MIAVYLVLSLAALVWLLELAWRPRRSKPPQMVHFDELELARRRRRAR